MQNSAEVRKVVVVRRKGNKYQGTQLDLKKTLYGEEGEAFFLRPNDIVYVPRTTITKVNQWIDQHINKNHSYTWRVALFNTRRWFGGSREARAVSRLRPWLPTSRLGFLVPCP